MKVYGQEERSDSIYKDPAVACRFLVSAVIVRALMDLKYPKVRPEVEEWLFEESDPEEPFSFEWCAQQIHLNTDFLREAIRTRADMLLSEWLQAEEPTAERW